MLTEDVIKYINKSVLCWLATSSINNMPNVSPKEIFVHYKDTNIIIANIASPQTIKNIDQNPNVCVSFIDIFVQKGYQLKGSAEIVKKGTVGYELMEKSLLRLTKGEFPFSTITSILIKEVKPILAPKYIIHSQTTEQEQIQSALKLYALSNDI